MKHFNNREVERNCNTLTIAEYGIMFHALLHCEINTHTDFYCYFFLLSDLSFLGSGGGGGWSLSQLHMHEGRVHL